MTYRLLESKSLFLAFFAAAAFTGCATGIDHRGLAADAPPAGLVAIERAGSAASWPELVASARAADAVILGEQHDDGAGHAIQAAVVKAVFAARPNAALAMEMLDRDDGHVLDAYLDGRIDLEAFLARSHAGKWSSRENWFAWYQPMLDAARDGGHRVIPANAPRRLVTLARTGGYGAIEALGPLDRAMVTLPRFDIDVADYEARFRDLMTGHGAEGMPSMDEETIGGYFRAQRVWDATMAESIAQALQRGPVVMLVGRFHSDYDGGLVRELRARAPKAAILTISIAPQGEDDGESAGRADFVVQSAPKAEEDAPAAP